MLWRILIASLMLADVSFAMSGADPDVVSTLDLKKYTGVWYEIGHNPTPFQAACERSSAKYELRADGNIDVTNFCYRNNNVVSNIKGVASTVDPKVPAKLKVDFGLGRKGDYWVVAIDESYNWSVVSGPGKSSLFILARNAPLPKETVDAILNQLSRRGFDTSKIIYDKYPLESSPNSANGAFGGYCSGASYSGIWAFSFGPQSSNYHCQIVQAVVARYTNVPITRWSQGFYDMTGPNRVVMRCANNVAPIDGFGSTNLQNAYNYALYLGDVYCIFDVYSNGSIN